MRKGIRDEVESERGREDETEEAHTYTQTEREREDPYQFSRLPSPVLHRWCFFVQCERKGSLGKVDVRLPSDCSPSHVTLQLDAAGHARTAYHVRPVFLLTSIVLVLALSLSLLCFRLIFSLLISLCIACRFSPSSSHILFPGSYSRS